MKKNFRTVVLALVFLLVLMALFVAAPASQMPPVSVTPTVNWDEYQKVNTMGPKPDAFDASQFQKINTMGKPHK